jgi:alpha-mannosidase
MLTPKIEPRIRQYVEFLKVNRYREAAALNFETFETDKTFRAPPEAAAWEKITSPYPYGKPWHCSWFRAAFRCPGNSARPLYLRVIPNADSLAFIDGKPQGAFNPFHKKVKVADDGKEHILHVEAYAGHPYPGCDPFEGRRIMLTLDRQIRDYPNTFEGGSLVERIEPVYSLYYDVKCLFELAGTLEGNSLRRARILKGLYDALGGIPFTARGNALEEAAEKAARTIRPLLEAKNGPTVPEIHLAGHAHIDHAWLWHIGETGRKAARTYSNMVRLAGEYPEFVFIQSQPAQLEIIKNEYPEIFSAVKEAYEKGNWEPNGGMWVEADCNITGGESLIRQFLIGKAANRELLGADSDTLWLPDVFGYAAALPQILAGCGIKYFVTSKISWNDTTRFPYDTFIWRGIDGSAVKTHYLSSRAGYNGRVDPGSLAELWGAIQHKEIQSAAIHAVGEGDGGGGTTRGDLEMARRLANLEGAPKAAWKKVSAALDAIFGASPEWPQWRGELYLELHRGTYTTQAKTKAYNRRLEFALRHTELFFAIAAQEGWASYPREDLTGFWKKLLTNQFHDIIPGSSINRVYAEAEEEYQNIERGLEDMTGNLRRRILSLRGGGLALFNDLSWDREDPVSFALSAPVENPVLTGTAGVYPAQFYRDLDGGERLISAPKIPSLGWARFSLAEGTGGASPFAFTGETLETPFYRIRFDRQGRIDSLIDRRRNRELARGKLNRLVSAQDIPVRWDAWDIDADWTRFQEEEDRLLSTETAAWGPVCFRLRRDYAIGRSSTLVQDTVFYAGNPRIDFETKVDWRERQRLLKAGFDTALDAVQVRCEVQYGHLLRNTHRNLPQDRAKFEICAHKWIALEEEGGGIALLNNSKYGHDAAGGHMGLTLLRSPRAPDPEADQGEQRFTYSLLPFTGPFGEAGIVRAGYELNAPAAAEVSADVRAPASGGGAGDYSFLSVEGTGIIVESVKAPEARTPAGGVVIRLYESLGGRAEATLRFSREIASAALTDMLEANPRPLAAAGKTLTLDFRGFEIKTVLAAFTG